jgi:hypothetical protein
MNWCKYAQWGAKYRLIVESLPRMVAIKEHFLNAL